MLEGIELFRLTGDRMRYLTDRQTVISRNIANADTPHFRAQDLGPFTFQGALARLTGSPGDAPPLAMARTSASHLGDPPGTLVVRATRPTGYGEKPDGNTVSIEEQMVKSNDISNQFALATSAYSAAVTLMRTAIDAGK